MEKKKCKKCKECFEPNYYKEDWENEYCEKCGTQKKLLKNSGIEVGLFSQMSLDFVDGGKAREIALEYAATFSKETKTGIMFFGRAGSGKTHLAVSIARRIIEQKQILVKFVRVVDLLLGVRETYSRSERFRAEGERQIIDKYSRTPLLILDDMGAEKTTDWVRQVLYQIIDKRWIDQKPMIVTSNLNLEELEERLGERIASRIAGMCQLVEMRDCDYRLIKRK